MLLGAQGTFLALKITLFSWAIETHRYSWATQVTGHTGRYFSSRSNTFSSCSNTAHLAQMVVYAAVIADACMVSNVIDCDVHETPLTFDDGKSATARREGGAGDHRGRAHAPAYEQPRGSMY